MTEHPDFDCGTSLEFDMVEHPIEDMAEYLNDEGLYVFEYHTSLWGDVLQNSGKEQISLNVLGIGYPISFCANICFAFIVTGFDSA